jgi:insertion element IS1 protein InsB
VVKKKLSDLPAVESTLLEAKAEDILEMDELWSYVAKRTNKVWLWVAICRRTKQIVAFAIGDRSEKTCYKLWEAIPEKYKLCKSFSDYWHAYAKVFEQNNHKQVGKESGQTNHIERWNNTIRQRLGRLTRETLSFSKQLWWHEKVIHWFIVTYNLSVI